MFSTAALVAIPTLLIQGGTIIDGSGKPGFTADLRIKGTFIAEIGKLKPLPNETIVDANKLVVAPGFIDAHSHADSGISDDPSALSQLKQGITTAVVGQDGYWRKSVAEVYYDLSQIKPGINFATFSGHGGIRFKILGSDYKREATQKEIDKMIALVETDMKNGSLGLSTGLEYDPGYYATTDEVKQLAKVVAKYKGIYISHVRDESDKAFDAFQELVEIGKFAKVHAQISHIKLGTKAVHGKASQVILPENVTADVYPYLYWQSGLPALSPSRDWADRKIWEKGLDDVGGPENVRLTRCEGYPEWEGLNLVQISEKSKLDPISIIQKILSETRPHSVVVTAMKEPDLITFIKNPKIMFCSDGAIGGSHPRGAGSFPRILGRYVRDQKAISIEEAIRKMTSLTAATLKLNKRGLLKRGNWADIVIFDASTIEDRATPEKPTELSVGVVHVFVNGVHTLKNGEFNDLVGGLQLTRS